ncbi:MAG: ArsR/SmtB family transcription factor [Solirubrobacteraceae bacterium]
MNELPVIELEPKRTLGQGCCTDVELALAPEVVSELTAIAKALSDPVRLQIVDVLRRQEGAVCVCDLEALFDISQPTLSHHLKKLREAGLVGVVRRSQWAYHYVIPEKLEALESWLS